MSMMLKWLTSNKVLLAGFLSAGLLFFAAPAAHAATIVVNSADDVEVAVSGDGDCTLREAITNANNNTDETSGDCVAGDPTATAHDVINFNITGSGVHTIALDDEFPSISEGTTVNGYSQPGATVNTAAYPQPLNTNLRIEIVAGSSNTANLSIEGAPDTIIQGFAIQGGDYPLVVRQSPGVQIIGNFLGSHADGSAGAASQTTLGISDGSDDSFVGGNLPAERNSITSSGSCLNISDYSDIVPQSTNNVTVAGNFIGIAPDGTARPCGSGGVNIQGSSDTKLGWPVSGGGNIIVSNGVAVGISSSANNPSNDTQVKNNYVDVLADGVTPAGSSVLSILITGGATSTEGTSVGGPQPLEGNTLVGSSSSNALVVASNASKTVIRGNNIGVNKDNVVTVGPGISAIAFLGGSEHVVGGIDPDDANIIGVKGGGVSISDLDLLSIPARLAASKIAVLGNTYIAGPSTYLIDLSLASDTDADFNPDVFADQGPTPNDVGDGDTGANNYINTPIINSAEQTDSQAVVNFDLDAADSPSDEYRIEFFAKSASDPAEVIFIGAVVAGNGNAQQASFVLPNGISLAGQSVMATTTAIDNTTDSGFGPTSEFSVAQLATVNQDTDSSDSENHLATTGADQGLIILAAITFITAGSIISLKKGWLA